MIKREGIFLYLTLRLDRPGLALGDIYRKFYRTLNNAKKNIQFKKFSTLFIQNFIHLKSSQNIHSKIYSFKVSPIQKIIHSNLAQNIHSKFYSFKIQPKMFIQSLAFSKNHSFKNQL